MRKRVKIEGAKCTLKKSHDWAFFSLGNPNPKLLTNQDCILIQRRHDYFASAVLLFGLALLKPSSI